MVPKLVRAESKLMVQLIQLLLGSPLLALESSFDCIWSVLVSKVVWAESILVAQHCNEYPRVERLTKKSFTLFMPPQKKRVIRTPCFICNPAKDFSDFSS